MRIPLWIWIMIGLSVLSWIIPDGIPGEEFLLPAIAIIGILLRLRNFRFYQNQFKQYQQQKGAGAAGGGSSQGSAGGSSQGGSSFYNRFRNWNAGFQQPQGSTAVKDPYEILDVKRGASMDELKRAHRNKLKMFHPDIIASKKLGPEYKEFFEEKTREINEAYKQLGGK